MAGERCTTQTSETGDTKPCGRRELAVLMQAQRAHRNRENEGEVR